MSAEQLITKHLDIWTSAHKTRSSAGRGSSNKLDLYGIKKLRELILELAVRGKLVPQDPSDEPASELLKKIAAEKAQLIKEGKIKKEKPLPEITDEEMPYELPSGWAFVRLQKIINISSGDGLTADKMNGEGGIPVFGGNGVNGYHDLHNLNKPTIVIGRVGYYCGSIHITPEKAWVTDNAFETIFSETNIYIHFLYWLLRGTNLKENENATAQPVISGAKIYPIVVGLPPLDEQHRIVQKVVELMAFCDELEQAQTENIAAHAQLVEVLLTTLTNSKDHQELQANWQCIAEHFDTLFTTEDSIDQLKQTILQLAVMGKLVPQDPDDEPAYITYKKKINLDHSKIRSNKQKIKETTNIEIDKMPRIPKSWIYITVDNLYKNNFIFDYADGNHGSLYPRSSDFKDEGIYFLTAAQIDENGIIDWSSCPRLEDSYAKKLTKGWATEGDVFFTHNATVGRTAIADNPPSTDFLLGTSVTLYRINNQSIEPSYLQMYFQSKSWYNQAAAVMQQTTRNQVSITKQALFYIGLPPLKEQKEISKKYNEIISICDIILNSIRMSQHSKIKVVDALMYNEFG